jgi:hypothetical protein
MNRQVPRSGTWGWGGAGNDGVVLASRRCVQVRARLAGEIVVGETSWVLTASCVKTCRDPHKTASRRKRSKKKKPHLRYYGVAKANSFPAAGSIGQGQG